MQPHFPLVSVFNVLSPGFIDELCVASDEALQVCRVACPSLSRGKVRDTSGEEMWKPSNPTAAGILLSDFKP